MDIRPILSTLLRHKTAAALIVLEIALTCAIICNALFMVGERLTQMRQPSGIAVDELVRIQIIPVGNDADAAAQTRSDLQMLRSLPGVQGATTTNQVPFVNSSWNSGVNLQPEQQQPTVVATTYMGDDHFLDTFGIELVAGRYFTPDELIPNDALSDPEQEVTIPGVVVTRTLAERLFPGQDPLGKPIYVWGDKPVSIIGVVAHLIRPGSMGGPEGSQYSLVMPVRANYDLGGQYIVRTAPERRQEILESASKALRANGPKRIIIEDNTKTFRELRDAYYQQQRSMVWLLGIVCVALLLITALGIVGLASFWVQQRSKQIGIRRALGATRGQILRYFQTENFILATIGIVIGMLLAFGINQLLMGRYELPRLPLVYLPVGALALWLLGQLAVLGPARRAAAVPPAVATRSV
ncbi:MULTISPECIES: FtsX-like permease family protein [unclassified Luteimonas]|uniref:ABC transporter permease n=1 Tax=unclassified Luteimonas TaxID=2629088 RepID=UPI0018F09D83|nr:MULTISPECIES: FtsX-like permease family protein [unclassified Luteimonas]MBJ6978428.1 ABC transporter permease [Luteimonas sp. MC1895]MBJ6983324.1 ABC transporter permease [Luteimonas sp. MC1750]QQO06185.1 ABC transporter permease [Luteimonas sp. MC1750]